MKKQISLMLLLAMFLSKSFSQRFQPLQIGDHIPDITIRGFYDDDKKNVKISDLFKGKLLILDFWGTWCAACLSEIKTFPGLKAKFGEKLSIVAVGYESRKAIAALFNRRPEYQSIQWSTLYGDSILTKQLFPHKSIPHLAWIDSTGKIIAITDGEYLNSVNIADALAGKALVIRLKKDILGVEDIFSPFHVMDTNFIARSMITHRVSGITVDSKQPYTLTKPYKYNRVFIGSDDLQDMYWFALFAGKITATNYARLIFEIKDSLRFSPPKRAPNSFKLSAYKTYDNWADSNLYCYDLVLPKLTTDSLIRQYMISDLNRYFNFNGRLERRTIDCFVIQKQDTAKETDSISPNKIEIAILASAKTEPIPSSGLADYFNARIYLGYIIDESNLPPGSTINLELKYRALKPDQIAAMLRQSKLVLIKSKRMVSVYVVSEN